MRIDEGLFTDYFNGIQDKYSDTSLDLVTEDNRDVAESIQGAVKGLYVKSGDTRPFSTWFRENSLSIRNKVVANLRRTPHNKVVRDSFSDRLLEQSRVSIRDGSKDAESLMDVIINQMDLGERGTELISKRRASSGYIGEQVAKWHNNVRFPFNKLVDIEEQPVQYGAPDKEILYEKDVVQKGYYAVPVRKGIEIKVRPGPKDFPFGEGPPSPSLVQRVDRINDLYVDSLLSSIKRIETSTSERIQLDVAIASTQPVHGWIHRLAVGEYLRSLQQTLIMQYNLMGFKFFKWTLTPSHTDRIERWGMERDWCDDLAETPLELSIPNEKDRLLIYNMSDDALPQYVQRDYKYWDGRLFRTKTLDLKYNGIFPTSLAGTKVVHTVVHKWSMVTVGKGTRRRRMQKVYGRCIRDLRIPPHPFCSCVMIPLFDPSHPEDFLRKDKTILEQAIEKKGVTEAAINTVMESIARRSQTQFITRKIVEAVLMASLGPELSEVLTEPVFRYGPDVVFLTPAELYALPFAA